MLAGGVAGRLGDIPTTHEATRMGMTADRSDGWRLTNGAASHLNGPAAGQCFGAFTSLCPIRQHGLAVLSHRQNCPVDKGNNSRHIVANLW